MGRRTVAPSTYQNSIKLDEHRRSRRPRTQPTDLKLEGNLSNRIDERLGCLEVLQTDWKGNPLATRATVACIGNGEFKKEDNGCIKSRRPSTTPMGFKLEGDLSNRIDERLGCLEVLQTDWKGNPLATRATAACIGNGGFKRM